jgi:hypothetical protein
MPSARAAMPPEAIRIEDEVWQEAFTRREPSASRSVRRLQAVDAGLTEPVPMRAPRAPHPHRATGRGAAAVTYAHSTGEPAGYAPTRLTGPRTVTIRGRGAERNVPAPRRAPRRAYERTGFRPDRVAMWAVLLGVLLVLVAVISAHG